MTKLLALDCSTAACSVAINHQGHIIQHFQVQPREHNRLILPMVEAVLAEAQCHLIEIDAVAFACGPASFTGIRLCTSVAQALAFGIDKPVIPISSLRILAQSASRKTGAKNVLVGLDARMHELYYAQYQMNDDNIMQLIGKELLLKPNQVQFALDEEQALIGDAWDTYASDFNFRAQSIHSNIYPEAYDLAVIAAQAYQLGHLFSAEHALPTYLRQDIT
ncbi:MAG: tRNA (adenosine(37)-N6)-threonylcarbamoyltransferase complex dimerization subunit type 1 TsaB [Gammaproteobacteria bacterium]